MKSGLDAILEEEEEEEDGKVPIPLMAMNMFCCSNISTTHFHFFFPTYASTNPEQISESGKMVNSVQAQ